MIKFAILPGYELEKLPEYSHGTSHLSMCIDMYAAEKAAFTRNVDKDYLTVDAAGLADGIYSLPFTTESVVDDWKSFASILPRADVKTGIVFDLPPGLHLSWGGRSGSAFHKGRLMFEGKIDADYRGEVSGLLYSINANDLDTYISKGEKFGQLEIVDYRSNNEKLRHIVKSHDIETLEAVATKLMTTGYLSEIDGVTESDITTALETIKFGFKMSVESGVSKGMAEFSLKKAYADIILDVDSSYLYQLVQVPYSEVDLRTNRGANGFGSTGN